MLEPQENGMIDLPDYEHIEDETFPPFPPPASPERQDGEGASGRSKKSPSKKNILEIIESLDFETSTKLVYR
uniref:TIMELESS-interacting protein n=1 Tax=Prolemur simus TaxID=1328070 RepID=A0A8C9AC36_PROSS